MKDTPSIRFGCSGWAYKHWRGPFFPKGLPQSRWFERYAEVFDTAELNNSFYRMPRPETFAKWSDNEIGRYAMDDARALKSLFD